MGSQMNKKLIAGGVTLAVAAVAACSPKAIPPPPPPPPPPPVVYIPPRPTPPLGASPLLVVPPLGLDGQRRTINAGILPTQAVWNLRSAYNVAALGCLRPEYADILIGYKKFLITHKKALVTANKAVDADFKKRNGAAFIRPREAYMTQVYNYYAFPPTLPSFCDTALVMARESMTLKSADLTAFGLRYIPQFDLVYLNFYRSYDQYKADAAGWDAKYAPVAVAPLAVPVPLTLPLTLPLPAPAPTPTPSATTPAR